MALDAHYFRINPEQPQPLYQQIQENLIDLIDSGLLASGDALPSERMLSVYYGVNRMTVRQSMDALVQRGLLVRRQGSGTFVTGKSLMQPFTPSVSGFTQRMREAGSVPSTVLLERCVIPADAGLVRRLQLEAGAPVIRLKRLRRVNQEPLMIETSYLSQVRYPRLMEENLEIQGLYDVLKQVYAVDIVEAEHTLEPTLMTAEEAAYLEVPEERPAMLVRVMARAVKQTPVEFSEAVVRGDRCRYYFRVNTREPIVS
jgi:GntR family transcriptional regulator